MAVAANADSLNVVHPFGVAPDGGGGNRGVGPGKPLKEEPLAGRDIAVGGRVLPFLEKKAPVDFDREVDIGRRDIAGEATGEKLEFKAAITSVAIFAVTPAIPMQKGKGGRGIHRPKLQA